jgi:hypothetical protein
MRKVILLAGFLPLILTACESTPNPYPNPGFYETRIEQDRYRIVYRAAPRTPRERAEDAALLRAAELTLQQGYDWFRIGARDMQVLQPNGPVISLGSGSTNFGRSSAVGVGLGTSFQLGGGPAQILSMEVQMGKGPTPDDRAAYTARDVAETLRARI